MKKLMGCLWVVVAVLVLIIVVGLVASSGSKDEAVEEVEAMVEPTAEPEESVMPTIAGSQAYDFMSSIEQFGFEQPETQITDDGYRWDYVSQEYSYTIEANKNHEISYFEIMILSEDADTSFLSYAATIPYDAADAEAANAWVSEHLGEETSATFGDAVYTLSMGTQGAILNISAEGRDDYLMQKIMSAMN